MKRLAALPLPLPLPIALSLALPAAAETLRCDGRKAASPVYLRLEAGRFELAEGSPAGWNDYCRPRDREEHARCRWRRGHLLAQASAVDAGRELEFNPRRRTLIIRDWAAVGGFSTAFMKLRCAPAAPGEAPPR